MKNNVKNFFSKKPLNSGKRVLTITATFPSLIQPWLINQLLQIIGHGGDNRVIARRSELGVYASNIDKYNLLDNYQIIPEKKYKLILSLFKCFLSIGSLQALIRGMFNYLKIINSENYTIKEKLYSLSLLPYMGMNDIDVIHSHSEMAGYKFLPIIETINAPFVITFHGLPPVGVKPLNTKERKRYLNAASVILVNTEFAKKQYVSLGANPDIIKIIPQGINLDEFVFVSKDFPQGKEINILTVGRFHPDKGQKYAIQAVACLIKQGFNIKYRLVGNGPDKDKLIQQAKSLGIINHVEFYSSVTDDVLREIYNQSHIFILPSLKARDGLHEETQGVVLQEAQASGLIVIATNSGGIPECIDDGISGFLVNERSSVDIELALSKLLSNPQQWDTYQRLGRNWVETHYDIKVIGDRLNEIYENIALS